MRLVKKVRRLGAGVAARPAWETSPLRPEFVLKTPPCSNACPNGNDIRGVLITIAQAETRGITYNQAFERAFYIIAEKNPFPAVCGRVCPHPCESKCNRAHLDGPASINCIERSVGDFALEKRLPLKRLTEDRYSEKIAVIGSGPAGLSCAYQLARRGHPVTIFEAFPKPGGTLRYGIPTYRLPRAILDAEIERILALGVELRCGTAVGKDVAYDDLRESYAAIFVGIGAHKGLRLGVPGEEVHNILSGLEFLHRVNVGERLDVGGTVVVVGGGGVAMDVAREAMRTGAKEVRLICLESREEMPAQHFEIEEALAEGIKILPRLGPKRILGENGRVSGLEIIAVRSVFDEARRFKPTFIEGSEAVLECDSVILAIGQTPDLSWVRPQGGVQVNPCGTIVVNPETMATTAPDVFAGGDVLELGIATTAIYHGRRAAETIHARLRGIPLESAPIPPVITHDKMRLDYYAKQARVEMATVPIAERFLDPDREVNLGLTREQVITEAKRCMSCGLCFQCDNCWKYCQDEAVIKPFEKGQPYRFKLEFCQGCKKCAEECPCGYIEMR